MGQDATVGDGTCYQAWGLELHLRKHMMEGEDWHPQALPWLSRTQRKFSLKSTFLNTHPQTLNTQISVVIKKKKIKHIYSQWVYLHLIYVGRWWVKHRFWPFLSKEGRLEGQKKLLTVGRMPQWPQDTTRTTRSLRHLSLAFTCHLVMQLSQPQFSHL